MGITAIAVAFAAGMYQANKRPITVHQEQHNHAAPVNVETTGGDPVYPKLMAGVLIALALGFAALLVVQGLTSAANSIGLELNRVTQPVSAPAVVIATPAPVPTARPVPTLAPFAVPVPVTGETQIQWYHIVIPVLVVVVVVVWGSIAVMLFQRRPIRRANAIAPMDSRKREAELEAMIPNAVNNLDTVEYEIAHKFDRRSM